MQLKDIHAVVSGGASGLGFAVANRFVLAGGKVTLLDVNQAQGAAAATTLGDSAAFIATDVTDESAVNDAVDKARQRMGSINAAVNCAGIATPLPMARELASSGIRVMTVAPGIFATPMMKGLPQEAQDSLGKQTPFPPRLGEPDEYAAMVAHIMENVMLNGESIRLDGAIRMQPR